MATHLEGHIIYWADAGFGFIRSRDNKEYFVHRSDFADLPLNDNPKRGDHICFETGTNKRGICARHAKIVHRPEKGLSALAEELAKKGGEAVKS
jgi:cold shock CspA family protein